MKKISLLVIMTFMSLSYSFSQSSYTFESLSASNPAITYIATITYNLNNTATVSRTSRPSVIGDATKVFVDLPSLDYTLNISDASTCINFNIQSQTGYIFYIDENILVPTINGGEGSFCVDCSCGKVVTGETDGHCKGKGTLLGTGVSQVNVLVVCENVKNCEYCKVAGVSQGTSNNYHPSGAVIFKAVSAN